MSTGGVYSTCAPKVDTRTLEILLTKKSWKLLQLKEGAAFGINKVFKVK